MSNFDLTTETVEGACVVRAQGKFDRDAGEAVEAVVREHEEASSFVLNMEGVDYISSSGVAALVKLTTSSGLRIASPAACVTDVLSLAGVARILSIHDDEKAALDADG